MAEDKPASKPVVRRVVKKATASPTPTVRYGRPVAPKGSPTPRVDAPRPVREPRDVSADVITEERPDPVVQKAPRRRPSLPRMPGVAKVRKPAVGAGFRRAGLAISDTFWNGVDAVRSWRLPHLAGVPASLSTGVIVGLVSVGLGVGALQLFSWLRGVASGGGTWGSLTFVVVAFIAFVIGELLLTGFGTPSPRLTSFLGVVLTIVVMLVVYIDQSDTRWALLIIPSVAATSFTVAHWLMVAANQSAESEE